MGGGGSEHSTVTNKTEVDPVTQAWRKQIMNLGGALIGQGTPQYYPGSTVVPFADATQQGLNYLQGHASQGATGLGNAWNATARAMSGFNPATPLAMGAAQGGLSGNGAMGALSQFGGASNPHLDSLFARGAQQVSDAVNTNFAQAGRYGPGAAHTGALTRGIGDLYTGIYAPAYEAERNRGLSAAQTMGSLYDSGMDRTLAGTELLGGLYSQGNEDAMRGAAMLPGLYNYGMMPGQSLLDIGGMYEGQAQNYLNADRARYDYQAQAPWDYLGRYAQMMSGMPDFSGSTSTTTGPGTNRLMSGMGGAAAGAGIAGGLGLAGPWGWALGGLGALGGLFG